MEQRAAPTANKGALGKKKCDVEDLTQTASQGDLGSVPSRLELNAEAAKIKVSSSVRSCEKPQPPLEASLPATSTSHGFPCQSGSMPYSGS